MLVANGEMGDKYNSAGEDAEDFRAGAMRSVDGICTRNPGRGDDFGEPRTA